MSSTDQLNSTRLIIGTVSTVVGIAGCVVFCCVLYCKWHYYSQQQQQRQRMNRNFRPVTQTQTTTYDIQSSTTGPQQLYPHTNTQQPAPYPQQPAPYPQQQYYTQQQPEATAIDPKMIYPPNAEWTGAPPPSYNQAALYHAPSNELLDPSLSTQSQTVNTTQLSSTTETQPLDNTSPPYPADGGESAPQYEVTYQTGDTQENITASPGDDLPAGTDDSAELA